MNKNETYLKNEFKGLKREVEDLLMTTVNDNISNHLDKVANEKYSEIINLENNIMRLMNKVTDNESLERYKDELVNEINIMGEAMDELSNFFSDGKSAFGEDVIGFLLKEVTPLNKKIDEVLFVIHHNSYNKTWNQLKFQRKDLDTTIECLFTNIISGTLQVYLDLMYKSWENVVLKTREKDVEIEMYCKDKNNTSNKPVKQARLEKILETDKMDKILRKLGYAPIRQKGSHLIYGNDKGTSIPVPQHNALDKGLGYSIQKQTRII